MKTHIFYYSPFEKIGHVDYHIPDDHKIVCHRGFSHFPETSLDRDGNIIFEGIHEYPDQGQAEITGMFSVMKPIYEEYYAEYKKIYNPLSGLYREIFVQEWPLDQKPDNIEVKKEQRIKEWIEAYNFMLHNEKLDYYRKYVGKDHHLFRDCYDIKKIEIFPLVGREKIENNYPLRLIFNDCNYVFEDNIMHFNQEQFDKMGPTGILFSQNITRRFHIFGLTGGEYHSYKIVVTDDLPPNISF